jgi:hypothetical protein
MWLGYERMSRKPASQPTLQAKLAENEIEIKRAQLCDYRRCDVPLLFHGRDSIDLGDRSTVEVCGEENI